MSYINLKVRKGSPNYSFGYGDSLKLAADSPTLTLAILKLNAWNFVVRCHKWVLPSVLIDVTVLMQVELILS